MTEKTEKKDPVYKNVHEVLHFIQKNLKAPRGQFNKFGNYYFRSCEDIVEAVKLISPAGATLKLTDDIQLIGQRYYVKATASLCFNGECESVTAFAREEESQKGMSAGQLTGATSSYARKYALNGLFMIDDQKDADATNDHGKGEKKDDTKAEKPKAEAKPEPDLTHEQKINNEFLRTCARELKAIADYSVLEMWEEREEIKTGRDKINLTQKKWLQDKINEVKDRLNTINAG